jgi:hypothetical protein
MIRFACQQCQKIFKVEDKHAGQKSKCPKCGAVLLVPATEVNQRQVRDSSLPLDDNKVPTPPSSNISDDDIFDILNKPSQTHSDNAYDPVKQPPILSENAARTSKPPVPPSIPMQYNRDKTNTQTRTKSSSIVYLGIGGVLLVGISIGVTLWATGNLKSKSDSSKILAGNPTATFSADTARAPKDTKPGKVKINATWQYNDYVGSKPDTNAVVILIPKGFKGRVPSSASVITMPDPRILDISFDRVRKELLQKGVYLGRIGGNGITSIIGVPPGEYKLIIISSNTTDAPETYQSNEDLLAKYIDGPVATTQKVYFSEISVISGEEVEDSHDFGNTFLKMR